MRAQRSVRMLIGSVALTAGTVLASAATSFAHVSIVTYGTTFTANATNVIYFRVPHGCDDPGKPAGGYNARTNAVQVDLPPTVTGAKPQQIPGWDVAITKNGSGLVTSIKWTARSVDDSLADWTYGDFGVRATLNGVAGDVLVFTATQFCDFHDDKTAISPGLTHVWSGVDSPKITLVGATNKVTSAADLADVKGRVAAAEGTIAAQGAALTALDGRVTALETGWATLSSKITAAVARLGAAEKNIITLGTSSRMGWVSAGKSAAGTAVLADIPATYRWSTATVTIGGVVRGTMYLDKAADGSLVLGPTQSAGVKVGQQVEVTVRGHLVAEGTVR